ncbi:MAG: hypothetical protein H0X33_14070, partial [Taibaiella sp.]|nr:hypothetical protein [Taibaiella sp.]
MKRFLFLVLTLTPVVLLAQIPSVDYRRFDSVIIMKSGGTAELVIRNTTKDSLGFLFNTGNGKTQFRRAKQLNDSTLIFGIDTFHVKGGAGGSGSPNTPVGTNFKIAIAGTNNVKGLIYTAGLTADSTSNPNSITGKWDSAWAT